MPFTKIWIHLIFSTKNRSPLITEELKPLLIGHIITNAKEKNIFIDSINCVFDHIHILVSMNNDHSVSKVVQLLKGESSFWVNKQQLSKYRFEWQEEYIALSVSDSITGKVRKYIKNQAEHHRVKTFTEECESIMKIENAFG